MNERINNKIKKKYLSFNLALTVFLVLATNSFAQSSETRKMDFGENGNQIHFDMDLESGKMYVSAIYTNGEINGTSFLLNRDFIITKIQYDGKELKIDEIKKIILIDDYEIAQYNLPDFEQYIYIEYTGVLSGTTGIAPYVREKITPEFTYLRWETFFHPFFTNATSEEELLEDFSQPYLYNLQITVNVPHDHIAAFGHNDVQQVNNLDKVSFITSGNLPFSSIAIAIAEYQKMELQTGDYYFLKSTNTQKALDIIDPTMTYAYKFMSRHFGEMKLKGKLRAIEIPRGLGGFGITETHTTFIENGVLNSNLNMGHLVHEFIHLGWNAKTSDYIVQRARFFDEAFTSYFEFRVMEDLLGEDVAKKYIGNFHNTRGLELVPIKDFGKYEYGNLSYTIGALFLFELSQLLRVDVFDEVTTKFLQKYRDTPVNFDLFCTFYIDQTTNPELEGFFHRWIYTNEYSDTIH